MLSFQCLEGNLLEGVDGRYRQLCGRVFGANFLEFDRIRWDPRIHTFTTWRYSLIVVYAPLQLLPSYRLSSNLTVLWFYAPLHVLVIITPHIFLFCFLSSSLNNKKHRNKTTTTIPKIKKIKKKRESCLHGCLRSPGSRFYK